MTYSLFSVVAAAVVFFPVGSMQTHVSSKRNNLMLAALNVIVNILLQLFCSFNAGLQTHAFSQMLSEASYKHSDSKHVSARFVILHTSN